MAIRPVFISTKDNDFYREENIEFQFFNGFSETQKKRSIESLQHAFLLMHPTRKILEVSTKSQNPIGVMLSAFNLKIKGCDGREYFLESAFQGGKVFENGGPYIDILNKYPWEAKKDQRLKESGRIIGFTFEGLSFPIAPKTFFYDWLYFMALSQNPALMNEVQRYDSFTDIEFNPKKSLNCQARSAAIAVSIFSQGLWSDIPSPDGFRMAVYGTSDISDEQISLFD